MKLQASIRSRHMVRNFAHEPLESNDIDVLLDLARHAPSAGHSQATEFVVLEGPTQTSRYWNTTLTDDRRAAFRWQGLFAAPALVLVTTAPDRYLTRYQEPDKAATGRGEGLEKWPVPYWWVDAGAVVQNILLLATERKWGACLFGPFDHEESLKAEFGIDPAVRIAATIALGKPLEGPAGRSASRPRRPLETVLHRPEPSPS